MAKSNKPTKAQLLAFLKEMLATNAKWAQKALLCIASNQTPTEYDCEETHEINDIGFSGSDAEILTSFAKFLQSRNFLTNNQMKLLFKKIPKYAGQLMRQSYFKLDVLERLCKESLEAKANKNKAA